jgi:hypothetical protein
MPEQHKSAKKHTSFPKIIKTGVFFSTGFDMKAHFLLFLCCNCGHFCPQFHDFLSIISKPFDIFVDK